MKRYLFISSVLSAAVFSSIAHAVVIELDLDSTRTRRIAQTSDGRGNYPGWLDLRFGDFPRAYDPDQHKISISKVNKEDLERIFTFGEKILGLKEENENLIFNLSFIATEYTTGKAEEEPHWYYTYEISLPKEAFSSSLLDSSSSSSSSSSEVVDEKVFKFLPICIKYLEPGVSPKLRTIYDAKRK